MAYFGQSQMSKAPNALDYLKKKEQEKKKFNLFDFSDVTPKPQLNFGPGMSGPGITNFQDFKANIPQQPTQPTQPTQKSGFSLIPTANAMEEEDLLQQYLKDPKQDNNSKQQLFQALQDGESPDDIINYLQTSGYKGTQPTQEKGYFGYALEDVKSTPEAFKGLAERTKERFGKSSEIMQDEGIISGSIAGGLAGLGTAWDTAFTSGLQLLKIISPESVDEAVAGGIEKIAPTLQKLGDKIETFKQSSPEAKRLVDKTSLLLEGYTPIKGGQIAGQVAKKTAPVLKQGAEKTGEVLTRGGKQILKTPTLIKRGVGATSDVIDTGVEKAATKILGSSDGTKELFKATSPSYNTLSKNKDISKIVKNAKKADEAVIQYGYKPKNTTERVTAYNDTMKKVWSDIEKIRGGVDTKIDAGNIAKIIDDEVSKISVGGVINPAIQKDVTALLKQADYFRQIGKIDIPTLGNQRTLINAITNWGQTTEFGDTFSNIMKKVSSQIRQIEDDIISKAGKGVTGNKLKQYGALRNMYDDIVKQDIKALRAKGMAIDESFGRIAGISEAIGGIAQLFTKPKQALPTMLSGGSKLLLGKTAGKLKDTDFLIKTGYDKLSKNLKSNLKKNVNNIDNNKSTPIKYSEKSGKNTGGIKKEIKPSILSDKEKKLLKPNQQTNVSNKPLKKPKKTGGEVLKTKVDKVAEKTGAKTNLLPTNSKQVSKVSDDLKPITKLNTGEKIVLVRGEKEIVKNIRDNYEIDGIDIKLSDKELKSIYDYTGENFNNRSKLSKDVINSISKLPEYKGQTYRGMSMKESELKKLLDNGFFEDNGIMSTSKSLSVANKFGQSKGDEFVIFKIKSDSGRDIERASQFMKEQEVVFLPNTRFKIVNSTKKELPSIIEGEKRKATIIELVEQANKPKLLKKVSKVSDDLINEAKKFDQIDNYISYMQERGKILNEDAKSMKDLRHKIHSSKITDNNDCGVIDNINKIKYEIYNISEDYNIPINKEYINRIIKKIEDAVDFDEDTLEDIIDVSYMREGIEELNYAVEEFMKTADNLYGTEITPSGYSRTISGYGSRGVKGQELDIEQIYEQAHKAK